MLLNLNFEAMQRSTLLRYHEELCAIARDPMSAAERQEYRAVRERVAMRIAFLRRKA